MARRHHKEAEMEEHGHGHSHGMNMGYMFIVLAVIAYLGNYGTIPAALTWPLIFVALGAYFMMKPHDHCC